MEYLPPTVIAKFKIQEFRLRWTGIILKVDVQFKIIEGNIQHLEVIYVNHKNQFLRPRTGTGI